MVLGETRTSHERQDTRAPARRDKRPCSPSESWTFLSRRTTATSEPWTRWTRTIRVGMLTFYNRRGWVQ